MYTIRLDVNDIIYDKVMFFLKNIPVSNLKVEKFDEDSSLKKNDIVSFFHDSPLTDNVKLTRDQEVYKDRISL